MPNEVDPSLRWFVDENMIAIGKALAAVRNDLVYPGHRDCPITRGWADEEWLPVVGDNGLVVPMRDKRIRYRRPERDRLIDHGVKAFCLTASGNQSRWDMLQLLVRHWNRIEETSTLPGPFIYGISTGDFASSLRDVVHRRWSAASREGGARQPALASWPSPTGHDL